MSEKKNKIETKYKNISKHTIIIGVNHIKAGEIKELILRDERENAILIHGIAIGSLKRVVG